MSFTHRNTQENTATGSTTLVITKPTGLVVGDLMIAAIGKDDDPAITGEPSGWTKIAGQNTLTGNDISSWFGYKVADSGDVAASNFTWTGDSEDWSGVISAFIPSLGGPAFVGVSTDVLRQDDTTPISNSLTTTSSNLLVGYCTSAQADTGGLGSATAGYTDAGNPTTGTGNGDNGTILSYDLSGPGGSITFEANNAEATAESHPYVAEFNDSTVLGRAELLLQAKNYSGSGEWLDEANSHNAQFGSTSGDDTNDPQFLAHDGQNYVHLNGVDNNNLKIPDSAALDITGDIEFVLKVDVDDLTPPATRWYLDKTGGDAGYAVKQLANGKLRVTLRFTAGVKDADSTVTVPANTTWFKITVDVDNGASGWDTKFYTSTYTGSDEGGVGFSQLGSTVTQSGTQTIDASGQGVQIGDRVQVGNVGVAGDYYQVKMRNGIDGTLVLDVNLDDATEPFATFTERSSEAATVTINRASAGLYVVDQPSFGLHTNDYFEIPDHANLDFAGSNSFTIMALIRSSTIASGDDIFVAKKDNLTTSAGWALYRSTALGKVLIADGTADDDDTVTPLVAYTRANVAGVRDVSGDDVLAFLDGTASGSATTDSTTSTLANALPLRIGATAGTAANFFEGEIMAVVLWRSALTDADVSTAVDELVATGSIAITPAAVTVTAAAGSMVITTGSVPVTPDVVTVTASAGSMVITTTVPVTPGASSVTASPGGMTITTGSVAITPAAVTVTAAAGSMVATTTVGVTPDAVTVTAAAGSLTITTTASIAPSASVSVAAGSMVITTGSVAITPAGVTITAAPGSMVITTTAAIAASSSVSVAAGVLIVTSGAPVVPAIVTVNAAAGTVTITATVSIVPSAATVTAAGTVVVSAGLPFPGAGTYTGLSAYEALHRRIVFDGNASPAPSEAPELVRVITGGTDAGEILVVFGQDGAVSLGEVGAAVELSGQVVDTELEEALILFAELYSG